MNNSTEFKKHIAQLEGRGELGKPGLMYFDHKKIPTIGVGFNLQREDADEQLINCGVKKEELKNVKEGNKALEEKQMMALLDVTIKEAESNIKDKIGHKTYDSMHEKQRWALVSLTFNNPDLVGPNLTKYSIAPIDSVDQEKAYLEILLKSNKEHHKGLQNRREVEASWFLEGTNAVRAEHGIKLIKEHPLAKNTEHAHSGHKSYAEYKEHQNHKTKDWELVAKGIHQHKDHEDVERMLERKDRLSDRIEVPIACEKKQKNEFTQHQDVHLENEERYTPSPRIR